MSIEEAEAKAVSAKTFTFVPSIAKALKHKIIRQKKPP